MNMTDLLPDSIKKAMPKLYDTEDIPTKDKVLQVKYFDPMGRGTWYGVEFDGEDSFFGWCVSPLGEDCDEWGYFSISELAGAKNRFGVGIERDLYWKPKKFSELGR